MKNSADEALDPDDDLKASNELMKLKLELEHNMQMNDTSTLSPEIENQWLNQIYNFEKQYRDAPRIKVYDFIGRPSFSSADLLTSRQVRKELKRALSLLEEKSIVLDCCCKYEDLVIYRFVTDELFEHEMDSFSVKGMIHHFIYEEFHPNHDYDLRRFANDFIESIFNRKWEEQWGEHLLSSSIYFHGAEHTQPSISSIISIFQEAHTRLKVEKSNIENVTFDLNNNNGTVEALLEYKACPNQGKARLVKGKCSIQFVRRYDWWTVSGFKFPGFGD